MRTVFQNFLAGMVLWAIPVVVSGAEEGMAEWIGRLSSESFKDRVEAQARISEWARERPDVAKKILLREHEAATEPEARLRLRESLKDLVIDSHRKEHGEGYLGISMTDFQGALPGGDTGILVRMVVAGHPADLAGLKVNDIILAFGDFRCAGPGATEALVAEVKKWKPGAEVKLEVLWNGQKMDLPVTLGARPMGLPAAGPARFLNGVAGPQPDLEMLDKLEQEAREAFFREWLKEARRPRAAP